MQESKVDNEGTTVFTMTGGSSVSPNTFKKANQFLDTSSVFDIGGSYRNDTSNDTSSCTDSQESKTNELDVKMSELGLYGRQKETAVMKKCLDDLVETGKNKLVYISGLSGTGKTALAISIADTVAKKNGIFAMGKFDQKLRDSPYAGIAAAGRHICGEILHRKNSAEHLDFEDIRKAIMKNVGSELSTLSMILPEIEDIVGVSSDLLAQDDDMAGGDYGANKERLNTAIRMFFRTVATFFKPLVMVLDDVQWADLPSINLMEVLMTDDSSSNFMLVALYRSNEVTETHVVSKLIKTLDEKEKDFEFDTTKIQVGDLRVKQVDEILVDLLQLPSYRTADLAEIIHQRTGGNVFFVLNFIDMLKNQKLVVYSKVEKSWVWDESEIELETIATENVVDILKVRMATLPKRMQQVLQLAACLGASFKEDVLIKVVKDYFASQEDAQNPAQLTRYLTKAIEQGLLKMDNIGYRWIHDKIQEAALLITSESALNKMRYQIGNIMLRRLSRSEMDQFLFVVVNLLNVGIGSKMSPESSISLADLNLRAAERAMRLSGFEVAANYADIGIKLLPEGHWKSQYKLSLKLFTLATSAHGVLGAVEKMQVTYDAVLGQPNVPLSDRPPLYYAMLESLSGRDPVRGKELGHEVLAQLEHPVLKAGRKLAIFTRLNVIRTYDRNLKPEEASNLPRMTDKNALAAMKILSSLLVLTYITNKAELPAITSKMASLVKAYGVCDEAANAYCYRGSFASNLKVIDAHAKFAQRIMQRSKDRYSKAASKMYIHCLMSHTRDIRTVQKGYGDNYHYSLQVGDIQMALYSFMHVLYYALVSGHSLESTSEEARTTIRSLQRMNRGWQVGLMTILWQGVLNMQGQSEDPFVLKGEAMDETVMDPALPTTVDGALRIGFKAIIYAFCGNHQANVDEHLDLVLPAAGQLAGNGIGFWFEIYTAISCLHCARSRGRQSAKYRKFGQNTSKKVKRWIAEGCANLFQLDLLLDAELAVLARKSGKACEFYAKSIKAAEKMLRVNDAGLASERLGEYFLSRGDEKGAREALSKAIELYALWGSDLKVESIRSKHREVLRPSNVVQQEK